MKYIIQIIGGLGLLLMLNMCVQAGMLSHANIQNQKDEKAWAEGKNKPTMTEEDPVPGDYGKEPGGDF